MTKQYHILEKSLALAESRKGFGKEKLTLLLIKTKEYISRYGEDRFTTNIKEILNQYLERNKVHMVLDETFHTLIADFISEVSSNNTKGVKNKFK